MKTRKPNNDNGRNNPDSCCKSADYGLLAAYLDGDLPAVQAERFHRHLESCEYCRRMAEASAMAVRITGKARAARQDAWEKIPGDEIDRSKSALIHALRAEPAFVKSSDTAPSDNTRRLPSKAPAGFFARIGSMRFASYAGIAGMFLVIALVLFYNSGILRNLTANFSSDNTQEATKGQNDAAYGSYSPMEGNFVTGAAGDATEGSAEVKPSLSDDKREESDNGYMPEASSPSACQGDISADYATTSSLIPSSASSSVFYNDSEAAAIGRVYMTDGNYPWLDGENESCYLAAAAKALFSAEFSDAAFQYVGIFAYPETMVGAYETMFHNILDDADVNAKIEIITRANSQDLVEYTGEGEAGSILSQMEQDQASLLIISIGR